MHLKFPGTRQAAAESKAVVPHIKALRRVSCYATQAEQVWGCLATGHLETTNGAVVRPYESAQKEQQNSLKIKSRKTI